MLKVHILITERPDEDRFGVRCVFNSLRIGFPTAEIITQSNIGFRHDEWIADVFNHADRNDKLVFCDTDMIFYDNVEPYLSNIQEPLAGRYVPNYYNEVVKANEVCRFHTSLLLISNVDHVRRYIAEVTTAANYPYNPFAPFVFKQYGTSKFYDTCANLFHTVSPYHKKEFCPEFLEKYTHLGCGTMLNYIAARMQNGEAFKALHEQAKHNPHSVKGFWKEQDRYYTEHPVR